MGLSQRSWVLNCTLLLVDGQAEKLVCPVLPSLGSLLHIKGHSDAWEADKKNPDFSDSAKQIIWGPLNKRKRY